MKASIIMGREQKKNLKALNNWMSKKSLGFYSVAAALGLIAFGGFKNLKNIFGSSTRDITKANDKERTVKPYKNYSVRIKNVQL